MLSIIMKNIEALSLNKKNFSDLFSLTSFESASIVQFFHRNIAYFITCYFIIMLFIIFKNGC